MVESKQQILHELKIKRQTAQVLLTLIASDIK